MNVASEKHVQNFPRLRSALRRKQVRAAVVVVAAAVVCLAALSLWVPKRLFYTPYSSTVYSAEGELLGARIASDGQWRFPPSGSLPEKFAACLVAYEDKRFYRHFGVDPAAMARAVRLNIRSGDIVSGGSTLTMQLARLARGGKPRNVWQKAVESVWALQLEMRYTKEEILSLYSSHAPFGGNVVGVETASWRYFGRPAGELSWAESAMLAVLPNSPALIHPGRNRDALREKRDGLLRRLCENGTIDETQYELACMEPLPEAPVPLPSFAPHLTDRMTVQAPGTNVYTTVQARLQRRVQETVDSYARLYSSNHIYNAAAIVADIETGEVLAYAGNAGFAADEGRGNGVDVIPAPRSTGSILKPFLYAGMLNDGMILPSTLVSDVPLNINGFTPHNYNRRFYGSVPAHRAIERSLNVPLVRMLGSYNTGRFMELLKKQGMTTLRFSEDHYGASLILGGAEGNLWDLAGMYASMARVLSHYPSYSGRYDPSDIHPLSLTPVTAGEPILSVADPRLARHGLLSAASIWFTFEAMSALSRPEEESDWQQFESMKRIAWKTGTSYGSRDAWAIGVTPRYVVGVWVGNASGEGRAGLTGVGNAAPILFDIFSMLPGGAWFARPYDEMELVPICRRSGHRASDICDTVDSLYIPAAGIDTPVCPYHRIVHLSPDGRYRVNSSCAPVSEMEARPWFVLPPAQEYYYRMYNVDYKPLPPWKPGCEQPAQRSIEIIYPEHKAVLYLPRGFGGEQEKFVFRAAHAERGASIYWYVDGEYIGETSGTHQIALRAAPGEHILTLADDSGNSRRIIFSVRQ